MGVPDGPFKLIGRLTLFFSMDANDTSISLNPINWRVDLGVDCIGRLPATLLRWKV